LEEHTSNPPTVSDLAGKGHIYAWDGGFALLGKHARPIPVHSHQAIQIVFGRDADIRLRGSDEEPWRVYSGAIIPTRQPHSLDATAASLTVVLFVEPESNEGRALTELYLSDGIAPMDLAANGSADAARLLFTTAIETPGVDFFRPAAWRLIQALTHGVQPSVVTDERILRAVAYINANLSSDITLDQVAAEAFLSPSRFRHLFVEQTGMGLRPYVLWRRFLSVWEMLKVGESLSGAAHSAGFADAAHLTRTCNRMFGFPPSAIVIQKEPLHSIAEP